MAHQVTRSVSSYAVPAIPLVREDGAKVVLSEELSGDHRPVVLNFIYTTCTSICPLSSQTFAQLQSLLGSARDRVRLVSLSIDPEQDTPARLAEYGRKYGAGPEWHYYTGTTQASLAAQRAFAVYKGDKMSHTPVTLVRTVPGAQWVRFDGFATAADLMNELRATIASN
jgi:protein SCO1/2